MVGKYGIRMEWVQWYSAYASCGFMASKCFHLVIIKSTITKLADLNWNANLFVKLLDLPYQENILSLATYCQNYLCALTHCLLPLHHLQDEVNKCLYKRKITLLSHLPFSIQIITPNF